MCLNLCITAGEYWSIYVLSGIILIYSVAMCFIKNIISKRTRTNIRRIYYSLYLIGVVFVFSHLDKMTIKTLGQNKLGLAEEFWLFFISLFIGFVLDILVISAIVIKEVSFGNTKLQVAEEDIVHSVESQMNLTNNLTQKIKIYYYMFHSIEEYVKPLLKNIKNSTVDIIKEYQAFLSEYFSFQNEHETKEVEIGVEIIEESDVITKDEYKMSNKEYEKLKQHIILNKTYFLQKRKIHYMLIPYKSVILEYSTILIVMQSIKAMVKMEQYLILSLLQHFEEHIIYKYYHFNEKL